jgi:hypothetical protein
LILGLGLILCIVLGLGLILCIILGLGFGQPSLDMVGFGLRQKSYRPNLKSNAKSDISYEFWDFTHIKRQKLN